MTAPSGMTVGRLAHGIPAPNDGGEEAKLFQQFPQPASKSFFIAFTEITHEIASR